MKDISTILLASVFCPLLIDRIDFGSQHRIVRVRRWITTSKESQILDCVSPSKSRVTLRFFTLNDPFWWAMRRPDQRDFESGLNRRLSCGQL